MASRGSSSLVWISMSFAVSMWLAQGGRAIWRARTSPTIGRGLRRITGGAATAGIDPEAVPAPCLTGSRRRVCVIGDIHGQWDDLDVQTLHALKPNLVLFVGDFGNENYKIVESVAKLDFPKALVLGNHDAWESHRKGKASPRLIKQMQAIHSSNCDAGYKVLDFPSLGLNVLGGRPFSFGGGRMGKRPKWGLLQSLYGVPNHESSVARMVKNALEATKKSAEAMQIWVAHNGPAGLGESPRSIVGKDFPPVGGDWGDPDLRESLDKARGKGVRVPLVVFGHMHSHLMIGGCREMAVSDSEGTVYVNAAEVPRWDRSLHEKRCGHFTLVDVDIDEGKVVKAQGVWATPSGEVVGKKVLYDCDEESR